MTRLYQSEKTVLETYGLAAIFLDLAAMIESLINLKITPTIRKIPLQIATTGGCLNIYDRKTNSFKRRTHDPTNPHEIGSHYITDIAADSSGNLWFASSEIMLCKYSPESNQFTNYPFKHDSKPSIHSDISYKICIDSDGDIWFTTEIGLLKFDPKTETYAHYSTKSSDFKLNSNMTTDLVEYKKGVILVLTDHGGLNVLNKYTGEITYVMNSWYNNNSLSNNQLYAVCKTKHGQIWFGNFSGGINVLDKRNNKFHKLENIISDFKAINLANSILSVCEDANGEIWIGFDGQGIMILNPITKSIKTLEQYLKKNDFLKDKAITDIFRDKNNDLWIATYKWGVFRYNWATKKIAPFDYGFGIDEGISEKSIKSIAIDDRRNLYVGTMGAGLICYNIENKSLNYYRYSEEFEKGLTGDGTCKVFVSRDQKIWVATFSGLNLFDPDKKKFTWLLPSASDKYAMQALVVNDIFQDEKGQIWFGTDDGLFKFLEQKNGFVQILNEKKLNAKNIYSIQQDNFQNLWFGTDNGIVKYNTNTLKVETYNVQDGLQGKQYAIHSSASDRHGFLYFGGNKGLNIFKSEDISKDTTPPDIFITDIKLFNKEISFKTHPSVLSEPVNFVKQLNLKYNENTISFRFIALSFANPELNQYSYILDGFEKNWNLIGTKNEIIFTNLNPGQYTLRIKASNSDGFWNQKGISIKIIITPPFWKTITFRFLMVFCIILLIGLVFYLRMRQVNLQNRLLQKMVEERTKELNQKNKQLGTQAESLQEVNVLLEENQVQIKKQAEELYIQRNKLLETNNVKDKIFSIISHDLKGPLGSLLGLSSLIVEKFEEFPESQVIHDSHQSLFNLIENLLNWSRTQRGSIEYSPKKVDLVELFKANLKLFENQIEKKEIAVVEEYEKQTFPIYLDEDLINSVIRNLLNNAIKFSKKKGQIHIGFSVLENNAKAWIKDNGIGIETQNIEKLFSMQNTFSTPGTNNEKGTGLGLILCKEFIEKHNGKIWVESQINLGSTFFFTIPIDNSN